MDSAFSDPQDQYLKGRWKEQRDYYSKNSALNKSRYQLIQLLVAVASVAITGLAAATTVPTWIFALLGAFVAILTAVERIYRYGENWRKYRQTLEALKRERALFDNNVGPYKDRRTAFDLFVERSEQLIAEETGRYFQNMTPVEATVKPVPVDTDVALAVDTVPTTVRTPSSHTDSATASPIDIPGASATGGG